MRETPPESKEFLALRRSEHQRGPGAVLGGTAIRLRDGLAAKLVAIGVTPNSLTIVGFLLTCCASACLLVGASHVAPWEASRTSTGVSWWPLLTALFLAVAGLQDALDGAVARVGGLESRFGAVLDSTVDRFSDIAVCFACAMHFAFIDNITYVALSIIALANAVSISYVKARAEKVVGECSVGYWQRGERCAVLMVAAFFGHVPAALWLLATLPALTVLGRLRYAYLLSAGGRSREPAVWHRFLLWRHPRGSAGYDICAVVVLVFLVASPWRWPFLYGATDPLRHLFAAVIGP